MAYAVKCHKCCALAMMWIQTGTARLWRFNWHNSNALVRDVVADWINQTAADISLLCLAHVVHDSSEIGCS